MTDFAALVLMWWAMMAAMMLPVTVPWFRALARVGGGRGDLLRFGAGYFAVWLAFSLGAAAIQVKLASSGLFSDGRATPLVAGAVLATAGLYQLSPAKASCLKHCRSPLSFFLSRWDDGPVAALRLGTSHGLYCVGCCWALMLVGLATGVMSPWWMAILTGVVVLENMTKQGRAIGRWAGVGLLLLAFTACNDRGPVDCTADFRYGLTIEVVDSISLLPVDQAAGTITEGAYVEELMSFQGSTLVGAGERPGTYDIVVTAPDYQEWSRTGVTLGFDGCHVIGQAFEARLQPTE